MTIRHLKVFITLVENSTMRKTAQILFVSQPSISQTIQELEKHYNVKLFERSAQRLYLSDQGKLFYGYAKNAVEEFDKIESVMKKASDYNQVKIGASMSVGTYILNDYISLLENKLINIKTDVVVDNTTNIEQLVKEFKLDIGIVEGLVISDELVKVPLFKDELVIIAGIKHEFYKHDLVDLQMLHNQAFITRESGSVERNQFENLLKENNIKINRHWECSNIETIKNAVICGRGLAVISKLAIEKEVSLGLLKILPIKNHNMVRTINLIYHKDKYLSENLLNVINIIETK